MALISALINACALTFTEHKNILTTITADTTAPILFNSPLIASPINRLFLLTAVTAPLTTTLVLPHRQTFLPFQPRDEYHYPTPMPSMLFVIQDNVYLLMYLPPK